MICCLCGLSLDKPGTKFLRIFPYEVAITPNGKPVLVASSMDDGAEEKLACYLCPVLYGAPRDLIGANERAEV